MGLKTNAGISQYFDYQLVIFTLAHLLILKFKGATFLKSYNCLSDNDLLDLIKINDKIALPTIYTRYWDKLLTVAYNRLDELAEVEEIVQDIFISLWNLRKNLKLTIRIPT